MNAANECFGIEDTSYIETATQADYEANIATALESDPNVLITVGFLLTDATAAAADGQPRRRASSASTSSSPSTPPTWPASSSPRTSRGYVAGVLAASLTETGVIGVVGGLESVPPVVKFVNGYTAGAKATNPDINVLSIYNDSFTDPAKGASDASQFIGEGADVIFGAGGPTGSGGVAAAAEQGVWGIGVDLDEYYTTFAGGTAPGSDHLASSAMKRVDLATFELIASAVQDQFDQGLFVGDAANNMIALAPPHDAAVPQEAIDAANAALAGLADGSITTGLCGIDGLPLDGGSACEAAPAGSGAGTEAATATTGA